VQAGRSIKLRRRCTFGIASVAKAGSLPNPINVVLYAGTDFHMRALVSSDHAGGVCYDAPGMSDQPDYADNCFRPTNW